MFEKLKLFWKAYITALRLKANQLKSEIQQYKEEKKQK